MCENCGPDSCWVFLEAMNFICPTCESKCDLCGRCQDCGKGKK